MLPLTAHVPLPELALREGTPVSAAFDDVYFSRAGGMAETTHVFLQGNGLPARFAEKTDFTIAELGFGTGLNFLVTWQAFLKEAPPTHRLHYLSIEQFPLTPALLREVLALQPELAQLTEQLIAAYPLRLPGWHRITFDRVTITLGFGEASALMEDMDAPVDAWCLDGFSPAKNPGMWTPEVLQHLNRLSASDATLATFTSAGAVKRELTTQGFAIEKIAGYAHKRDMMIGRRASQRFSPPPNAAPSALIVGGGLAGCTLAYALAERGCKVHLFERGTIAQGASGNEAAVLFPQLSKRWTASAAWYFAAYSFMQQQVRRWHEAGLSFAAERPGMLRLPRHAEEEAQLRALHATLGLDASIVQWLEPQEASARAGLPLDTGGAYFPDGMWLAPAELCQALITHPNITYHKDTEITTCHREGDQWQLTTKMGERFAAMHCCFTAASETARLLPDYPMTLHAVAGQVSTLATDGVASPLQTILCHKGYVIPRGNAYLIGATYRHGTNDSTVTAEDHATNVAEVERFLPNWIQAPPIAGRVSLRATTPDRMPYAGLLAEGLWISAGHGSRGMLSAPLAAEAIASEIFGEQVPLIRELRAAVNPRRFKKS